VCSILCKPLNGYHAHVIRLFIAVDRIISQRHFPLRSLRRQIQRTTLPRAFNDSRLLVFSPLIDVIVLLRRNKHKRREWQNKGFLTDHGEHLVNNYCSANFAFSNTALKILICKWFNMILSNIITLITKKMDGVIFTPLRVILFHEYFIKLCACNVASSIISLLSGVTRT